MIVQTVERVDALLQVATRPGRPTVVLLHGLAGHRGEWDPVIDRLDRALGVIVPDQRGHAGSYVPGGSHIAQDRHADDVVALIRQFSEGPVVLVGQSMGGIVATIVAAAFPELVAHLVLIEAGMNSMTDSALSDLEGWFRSWPNVFADEAAAAEFFGYNSASTSAWVSGLRADEEGLVPRFSPSEMVATMEVLGRSDRWAEWSNLQMPATLIEASNGVLDRAEVEQMKAQGPDLRHVTAAGSGHDVHLDRPGVVADVIFAAVSG